MHLKYNYKNQLKGFKWWLDTWLIVLVLICVAWYYEVIEIESYLLYALIPWFIVFTVPLLLYHVRYYLRNRGQVIDILDDRLILTTRHGERKEYLFTDISEVFLHRSRTIEPGGFTTFSPMDYYCYLKIMIGVQYEDAREDELEPPVYITCFMHPDLDEVIKHLKGVTVTVRRSMFL